MPAAAARSSARPGKLARADKCPAKPPTAAAAPGVPAVAFNTGIDTSNLVTFALGGSTQVWFYANTTGNVHVHVDIVGSYVTPVNDAKGVPTSAGRFVPITTTRVFDSRANGGAIVGGTPRTFTVAPVAGTTFLTSVNEAFSLG